MDEDLFFVIETKLHPSAIYWNGSKWTTSLFDAVHFCREIDASNVLSFLKSCLEDPDDFEDSYIRGHSVSETN
jgi:hypothetical protein